MFCSTTGDGIEEQEDCVRLFGLFGDGSASSGELEMEEMEVDEAEDEWRGRQISGVP